MSQIEVKIKCIDCNNIIYQTIDKSSDSNHIYCPKCNSIFPLIDSMVIPEGMGPEVKNISPEVKNIGPEVKNIGPEVMLPESNQKINSKIEELTKLLDDTGVLKGLKERNINPKDIMDIISNANQLTNDLVEQNLQKALDEIPHTFIKSESIFLNGYINGNPISFLLDTGAETSILPMDVIQSSGLSNILDRKCSGTLLGVGEDKILGRIHYVEVVLECGVFPCSFTVCSNLNMPPILGIDMMFNLGISLDFKRRKIIFDSNYSIDFVTKSGIVSERKEKNSMIKLEIPKNPIDSIKEIIKKIEASHENLTSISKNVLLQTDELVL